MNFDTILKSRTSIKHFSSRKPKEEHIIDIIEAGNLAPSPGNLPILSYIIIENKEGITKISEACQQDFIKQSPTIIIICSNQKNINIMYDKRSNTYTKQQAGATIENMLLKITELKLASTWVGAFSEITIKNALKIPDNINVEAILPIGYPLKGNKTKQKAKTPLEGRVFFEKYKNKEKKKAKRIGSH
jgi:nitroreductase